MLRAVGISPPTDERPFFGNQLPLYNPLKILEIAIRKWHQVGVNAGTVHATATLVLLFSVSLVLVFVTIILPLQPAIKDVGKTVVIGGTMYFMLIGIGSMSLEIGLLQRMSVFLGHPIYSLSIVLFSLILATGVGSLLSDKFALDTVSKLVSWSALTGAYFITLPLWLPQVTLAFESEALIARALLCVLVIVPGGVLMGWGFPTGMRLVSRIDPTPTPWFWAINGAAGVLASSLAVALSIAMGINTTLIVGGICYLLLIPAVLILGAEPRAQTAPSQG